MNKLQLDAHLRMLEALKDKTRTHVGIFHEPLQGQNKRAPICPGLITEVKQMIALQYAPRTLCRKLRIALTTYYRILKLIGEPPRKRGRPKKNAFRNCP
jgi:hypothetical protein